ncbi:hypothetical protein KAR91_47555 [Candidatus Pacearchaeota archaeon]|nr:hypothetical protein [Candidatus Pacearchaeota archaeon]
MSYWECPECHVLREKDTVYPDGCIHCRFKALKKRVEILEKIVGLR